MTNENYASSSAGWVALATGMAGVLSTILIILFYTVGGPFGTLNDIFNGVAGILSGVLAWMVPPRFRPDFFMQRIAPLLAAIGAAVVMMGSIFIIFDVTGWVLAGWYTTLGNALIGMWLLTFSTSTRQNKKLPQNLSTLGWVAGSIMAVGVIAIIGTLMRIDLVETTPWYLSLGYVGYTGTYLLYPAWTLWLGRTLLSR